jgi:cytochrome oxidase assembly protein ShyY1
MAKNNPEANSWVYRDVETMAQVANVAPIFIDADYGNNSLQIGVSPLLARYPDSE